MSSKQPRNDDTSRDEGDKRARIEKVPESPINPDIFNTERLASLKKDYQNSFPFPHVRVQGLCIEERAKDLELEAKGSLKADFKETDLFKVYQTPDLANLGSVTSNNGLDDTTDETNQGNNIGSTTSMASSWHAPNLVALRDAIYSKKFREFVSELSGCGELEDRADCSCNAYVEGGHLLCHDDVINTRRISYIIYLTDPEDKWTVKDGGALELYPLSKDGIGCPDTTPVKNILPEFNSMVFFTVVPGESFHAVQEVFTAGKPRLSISGWYHGKEPPPGMENATRAQLSGVNADATTALSPWVRLSEKAEEEEEEDDEEDEELEPVNLSKEDMEYLSQWLNPDYLDLNVLTQLREEFLDPENGSAIQLDEFLISEVSDKIRAATTQADKNDKLGEIDKLDHASSAPTDSMTPTMIPYDTGVGNGWQACGPVHKQRFLHYVPEGDDKKHDDKLHALHQVRQVIESGPFQRWISEVTCFKLLQSRSLTRRFRPGLDYTVAHVGTLAKNGNCALDATLSFVDDGMVIDKEDKTSHKKKQEKSGKWHQWDSGEVGGFECYVEVDDEVDENGDCDPNSKDAAPEVYDNRSAREYGEGVSSSSSKKQKRKNENAAEDHEEEEEEFDSEDEEEPGGTLLSVQARFNTLSLVTRDQGVMHFIKYVSAFAPGSRWDIATEYQVN